MVAPGGRPLLLAGNERVGATMDTLCLSDVDSGSLARLPASGAPWAWDGDRRFANIYQGVEMDPWTDPTPDDPADHQTWLARELPPHRPPLHPAHRPIDTRAQA